MADCLYNVYLHHFTDLRAFLTRASVSPEPSLRTHVAIFLQILKNGFSFSIKNVFFKESFILFFFIHSNSTLRTEKRHFLLKSFRRRVCTPHLLGWVERFDLKFSKNIWGGYYCECLTATRDKKKGKHSPTKWTWNWVFSPYPSRYEMHSSVQTERYKERKKNGYAYLICTTKRFGLTLNPRNRCMVAHYFRNGRMERLQKSFLIISVDVLLRKMKCCSK